MDVTNGMTTEEISGAAFTSVMETNDKLMKGIDVLKRQRDTLLELVKEAMPYMEKYAIYDGGWTARARDILETEEAPTVENTFLTEEEYPVLARTWDNASDKIFDEEEDDDARD